MQHHEYLGITVNHILCHFLPPRLLYCRELSIIEFKSFFFFTLLEWCLVLPSFSCMSLPVLLDHCKLVS